MRSLIQLLRQPGKSIAAFLLAASAVAVLIICVGQYCSVILTRADLDDGYATIALISDKYFWEKNTYHTSLNEEIQDWINYTIENRQDMIKTESYTGLLSAYIPDLLVDNFSQYDDGDRMSMVGGEAYGGNPYRCAILQVKLTQIGETPDEDIIIFENADGEKQAMRNNVSLVCTGTVEGVIGLEQGFESPIGKTIAITIVVYSDDELKELDLVTGESYLLFGADYSDLHGETLKQQINNNSAAYKELFGTDNTASIMEQIDCSITVCDYSSFPWNYVDDGKFVTLVDRRRYLYRDKEGVHAVSVSADEYISDYCVPTIARLEETAEEYLKSKEGEPWKQMLNEMEISNHGFPVLAVDKLNYQVAFAREQARITDGRDFTESERKNGSKVCIISESVASLNNLKVGDSINMQPYAYDLNIKQQQSELMNSTSFPEAAIYSRAKGFTAEMEAYRIVGLYRQNNAWQNAGDAYGFTPNTIFVPKASVTGEMLTGKSGIYYTLVLHNGRMEEFRKLQAEAGFPELFICMDQGYMEIAEELNAYEGVAVNALYIGIAVYTVMMLLFLVLFPLQQGSVMDTMNALGTPRRGKIGYMLSATLGILIPGGIMGGILGALLWRRAADRLMATVSVQIPLKAEMAVVAPCLTAAHLMLMAAVVFLVAAGMSREKRLVQRK